MTTPPRRRLLDLRLSLRRVLQRCGFLPRAVDRTLWIHGVDAAAFRAAEPLVERLAGTFPRLGIRRVTGDRDTWLWLREPDRMLVGGFVRVSPEDTEAAAVDWVAAGGHEGYGTRRQWWTVYRRHYKSRLQIALGRRRRPHNLGLNMSLRREHLVRVNGYDERYRGWGNADGDLRERLKCIGIWPRSVWDRCVVYHLHHPPHPPHPTRHDTAANRARARRPRRGFIVEQGIVRLSGGPAADAAL